MTTTAAATDLCTIEQDRSRFNDQFGEMSERARVKVKDRERVRAKEKGRARVKARARAKAKEWEKARAKALNWAQASFLTHPRRLPK